MKKRIIFFIIGMIFVDSLYGYNSTVTSKAKGMGEALIGSVGDVNSLDFNPAGLGNILHKEIYLSYYKFYLGINNFSLYYTGLKFVAPIKFFNFYNKLGAGLSYSMFSADNLYFFHNLKGGIGIKLWKFLLGCNIKFLMKQYRFDNFSFNMGEYNTDDLLTLKSYSKTGISIDVGCQILVEESNSYFKNFSFGLVIYNLLPLDLGRKYEDKAPLLIGLGIGYLELKKDFTINSDIIYDLNNNIFADYRIGIEKKINKFFTLRSGLNTTSISIGLGYSRNVFTNFKMYFDYAFIYKYLVQESYGDHSMTIGVKF